MSSEGLPKKGQQCDLGSAAAFAAQSAEGEGCQVVVGLIVKYVFSENAPQTLTLTGMSLNLFCLTGLCLRIKLQRCLPFRHKVRYRL